MHLSERLSEVVSTSSDENTFLRTVMAKLISSIQIIRNNESDPSTLLGIAPMIERQIITLKSSAFQTKSLEDKVQVILKLNTLKYNSLT